MCTMYKAARGAYKKPWHMNNSFADQVFCEDRALEREGMQDFFECFSDSEVNDGILIPLRNT